MVSNELLRRDVRILGEMLGQIIRDLAGPSSLELVERIRLLARERRNGMADAERLLIQLVDGLSIDEARVVARAFSIYFDLANIAEDRHRVRVLREREFRLQPEPVSESIVAAISDLREHGQSASDVQVHLNRLSIELVFTAHPSEAKRRSIRAKLRRMRFALQELDRTDLLPRERQSLSDTIRAELCVLWQTEFLHPTRPEVLDEVDRGLATMTRLWEVVPDVYQALRRALERNYPESTFELPCFLRFGFWMGGDRDGNPHVTWDITAKTLCRLRRTAISLHLEWCARIFSYLTIALPSDSPQATLVQAKIDQALKQWPATQSSVSLVDVGERYRRWLRIVQWRLQQSVTENLHAPLPDGAYRDSADLVDDIQLLCSCLDQTGDSMPLRQEVLRWHDLAKTFGLFLAHLDVRQDAKHYQEIIAELLAACGQCANYMSLDEENKCQVLSETLGASDRLRAEGLSPLGQETLQLFELLHAAIEHFGPSCLGGSVISLTRSASDVLSVLWLWRRSGRVGQEETTADAGIRIIPLFEQIEDLRRAPATLAALLDNPAYAAYLARQGNRQVVMVGYSDSTKDGGYVAATWGLFQAQNELHAIAAERNVDITFFHGRGGSLGRGGGPAARGILSLPPQSLDGTLRLTEQGEVLAERYDDSQIAYRHLEQVFWAVLTGSAHPRSAPPESWQRQMRDLSERSRVAYRALVDMPGFMHFFEMASPIEEIENLPIASRPSRRRGERSLSDLRAIPWVFAWTQNRCLIPAWYGLGTALEHAQKDPTSWQLLRSMYAEWPLLQAMIDNASLALAKADMYVAERYAELEEDTEVRKAVWLRIVQEFEQSRAGILALTDRTELLANIPWFQSSIEVRNPYVDPLNLIQIDFLRRSREDPGNESSQVAIRDLLRLTVQGIAAGMRTTG